VQTRPVRDVLHAALDAAVATLEGAGVPVPDRRYIAAGASAQDVPWDCEQLTVVPAPGIRRGTAVPGAAAAQLTRQRGTGVLVPVLDFEVQLVRCYPTARPSKNRQHVELPTADELDAAGDRLADDLDAIAAVLTGYATFGLDGPPNMITVGAAGAVGPEGGFVAVVGAVSISLMG
jgi:hypothetical protein